MDHILPKEGEFTVDLESGLITDDEVGSANSGFRGKPAKTFFIKLFRGVMSVDLSLKGENLVKLSVNAPNCNEVSPENRKVLIEKNVESEKSGDLSEKKMGKENRKKISAKKPPKPPRPPRGLSLDAADQKLIKEIAQLAMIKRARIERMKAMKKIKAAKASSSSGSLLAMLFTVLFCIVLLFQGMSSGSSAVSFESSPDTGRTTVGGFISVQNQLTPSATDTISSVSGSPNLVEQISSYDPSSKVSRAVG